MGWIKRNLFFVVSGVVALALLGGTGFYIYEGWSKNSQLAGQLNDIYSKLSELAQTQPQPGNDKINNTEKAKEQEQQIRDWMGQAAGRFQPIPAIPQGDVTSKTFANALNMTTYQLRDEAKESSVSLPHDYFFSFQVQSSKLTISSGLAPLAQQLGEVKAIAEVLFDARVNSLDNIQRVRVSDDDLTGGLQSDYTEKVPVTNELAIITPYEVTFQSFTPELAKVISGMAASTNPFVVKSVSVQPASAPAGMPGAYASSPDYNSGRFSVPQGMEGRFSAPGSRGGYPPPAYPGYPQPIQPQQPAPTGLTSRRGGLPTVLKEQLLRITLEVDVVKLQLKN